MLRRGNFWDNAPQESFGTLEDVKREIKSYMTYYNHYRGQWNLKKMTPVRYKRHLLQVA